MKTRAAGATRALSRCESSGGHPDARHRVLISFMRWAVDGEHGRRPQESLAGITAAPEEFFEEQVTVAGVIGPATFVIAPQEETFNGELDWNRFARTDTRTLDTGGMRLISGTSPTPR